MRDSAPWGRYGCRVPGLVYSCGGEGEMMLWLILRRQVQRGRDSGSLTRACTAEALAGGLISPAEADGIEGMHKSHAWLPARAAMIGLSSYCCNICVSFCLSCCCLSAEAANDACAIVPQQQQRE